MPHTTQSHPPPVWLTVFFLVPLKQAQISIHTLHTEGDMFYPSPIHQEIFISIHTLHTEGDGLPKMQTVLYYQISIHTLHTEGD